jgi:sialic acid synthase SpsE
VAGKNMTSGKDNPEKIYIIAETAYIHEGDFEYLFKMIDEISELKLDAIKFHLLLNPDSYMSKEHPLSDEIKKWLFTKKQWTELIQQAIDKNLDVIALCDDVESVEYIKNNYNDIFAIEIHATGINDYFLLQEVADFKGKIILGIGGTSVEEIKYAVDFLKNKGKRDIILMYGFQNYPTNYKEINLQKMIKMKDLFNLPVGYADHTSYDDPNNEIISIMGAVIGSNILEKHYTLDPGVERIDYIAAVGKKQMKKIKEMTQLTSHIYGDSKLEMSKNEKAYGSVGPMKKAIVARCLIKKGEEISLDNIWFKRTAEESTVKQNQLPLLLGLKAIEDIEKDKIINFDKVENTLKKPNSGTIGINQKK